MSNAQDCLSSVDDFCQMSVTKFANRTDAVFQWIFADCIHGGPDPITAFRSAPYGIETGQILLAYWNYRCSCNEVAAEGGSEGRNVKEENCAPVSNGLRDFDDCIFGRCSRARIDSG